MNLWCQNLNLEVIHTQKYHINFGLSHNGYGSVYKN